MVKTLIFALLATMCAAFLWGCGGKVSYTTVDGTMLGTTLHVVADVQGTSPQELYAAVMALDREAKASMSIFDPASLLSRLNRNETDSVDRHIAFNLRLADSISSLSDGRYDVTVKPLVEAWGFAGKEAQENPNIDSILAFVGRGKVRIENGRLIKDDPRVQLDFNSIAKGYIVDLLAQLVESFGARNYIVDIGGEVRCKGVNRQGDPWRIGIETPYDNNFSDRDLQRIAEVTDISYTTSGNYRRFYYTPDGRKIAHTIDPVTGRSAVSRLLSATVFCDNAARADALGTMFMSLGSERAVAKARELEREGVMAYFIFATEKADGRQRDESPDDYETWASPALEKLLKR